MPSLNTNPSLHWGCNYFLHVWIFHHFLVVLLTMVAPRRSFISFTFISCMEVPCRLIESAIHRTIGRFWDWVNWWIFIVSISFTFWWWYYYSLQERVALVNVFSFCSFVFWGNLRAKSEYGEIKSYSCHQSAECWGSTSYPWILISSYLGLLLGPTFVWDSIVERC